MVGFGMKYQSKVLLIMSDYKGLSFQVVGTGEMSVNCAAKLNFALEDASRVAHATSHKLSCR